MQVREFYPDNKIFTYQDIMEFIYYNRDEYKLREIVSNTFWRVESYFDVFKDNKSFMVVFNPDCVSPHRDYNYIEAQLLVDRLDEQYKEINQIINVKLKDI